jgi:hypothetical protein
VFINGLSTGWSSAEDPFPRSETAQQAAVAAIRRAPRQITFSAHGGMVFVVDLAPGVHAIRSYNTFEDGSVQDFTKHVKVIQR